ncbi:hypothetical protein [Streptomyces macrosporus]|uniref:Uncharacterized protein n=1 Tax=Streptomyces macrosporus TaxID=44032 RepID=A0ABN3KIK1_9ACTN
MSTEVITTSGSDRYHAREDCDWYQAGRRGSEAQGYRLHEPTWTSVAEAEAAGRTACGNCVTGSAHA